MTADTTGSTFSLRTPALILFIVLFGFAVRVVSLSGDSFWFDELLTLHAAQQDAGTILTERALDRPPGYSLLEHYAIGLWGEGEFGTRLLSAAAGTLTIPLLYVAGSLIANRRIGVLAALLIAVAPFHLRYSQEARGYAIQVALAVAATACLLLALKRRQWRWWIGFGISSALNVYILFGAFLVLGSHVMFVVTLTALQWLRKRWTRGDALFALGGLLAGILIVGLLYSPYVEPALRGMLANIGPEARQSAWYGVPLGDWALAAYLAFGYMHDFAAAVLGGLGLIGLAVAIARRNLWATLWLIIGLATPLLAINLAGLSRAPLPKYVLFLLPVYLLAVAIGLEAMLGWLERLVRRFHVPAARFVPAVAVLAVIGVSLPTLAAEHQYADEDWRDLLSYVKTVGQDGDVFVPITLDLSDGFNQGETGLKHYLPQYFSKYLLLMGEHLTDPEVADLPAAAQSNGNVWITLLQRNHPIAFADPIEVKAFQGSFYLVHPPNTEKSALEELIALYPQIIAQADTPAPQCYLWFDLARLYAQADRYDDASAAMAQAPLHCPDSLGIRRAIYEQLVEHYLQSRQADRARDIALKILALDSKDRLALQALSVYNLSDLFQAGAPEVTARPSPARPIDIQRFSMPQSGDWGDALVMQTPAQMVFRLNLPPAPVNFVSRIAMSPESWDWGGDGARFRVRLADADGRETVAFDQYISNQETDRTWHDVEVPLRQYAGQTITLTLETDPGPLGDTTGDWAGWDTPRIAYAAEGPAAP
jgi:mannosyltransferase